LLNKLQTSEIIEDVLTHTALSLRPKSLIFSLQQKVRNVCIRRHFNLTLRDVSGYCTVVHTGKAGRARVSRRIIKSRVAEGI